MQPEITIPKHFKKIAIFGCLAFIGLVIIISLVNFISGRIADAENTVQIANLESCTKGIDYDAKLWLQRKSYEYVVAQLEVAGEDQPLLQYDATLRDGSCQNSQYSDGDGSSSHSAIFIMDIPSLQYSYQVTLSYLAPGDTTNGSLDLGSPLLYCLPTSESIYPDFNCAKNPLILAYDNGATELNDIRNILPYFDEDGHYYVQLAASTETKSGYTIVITYTPSTEYYVNGNIEEYHQTYRAIIDDYLTSHSQDLSDFDFFEKWK